MADTISVVIPCFNSCKWLRQVLSSVFTQSPKSLDVIVVNDGSSDSSAETLRRFQIKVPRLHVIDLPSNRGIVNALNIGLDHARGNFIARMDADDICAPDRFSNQLSSIKNTGADACGSWFVEFGKGIPRTCDGRIQSRLYAPQCCSRIRCVTRRSLLVVRFLTASVIARITVLLRIMIFSRVRAMKSGLPSSPKRCCVIAVTGISPPRPDAMRWRQ